MPYHQVEETAVETETAVHSQASPDRDRISAQPAAASALSGMEGDVRSSRRVLQRVTNGRVSRASTALLQLQNQYGNQYVQRLMNPQQRLTVQPKLMLGDVDTPSEREADQIARQTMGRGQVTNSPTPVNGAMTPIASETENTINQARGGGNTLPPKTRLHMEQRLGADFSGVRVHTDERAHQLNLSLQARAFTTGQDVFFKRGEYNPGSSSGQEILAHELTHVVQQSGPRLVQSKPDTNRHHPGCGCHACNQVQLKRDNVPSVVQRMIEKTGPNIEDAPSTKKLRDYIYHTIVNQRDQTFKQAVEEFLSSPPFLIKDKKGVFGPKNKQVNCVNMVKTNWQQLTRDVDEEDTTDEITDKTTLKPLYEAVENIKKCINLYKINYPDHPNKRNTQAAQELPGTIPNTARSYRIAKLIKEKYTGKITMLGVLSMPNGNVYVSHSGFFDDTNKIKFQNAVNSASLALGAPINLIPKERSQYPEYKNIQSYYKQKLTEQGITETSTDPKLIDKIVHHGVYKGYPIGVCAAPHAIYDHPSSTADFPSDMYGPEPMGMTEIFTGDSANVWGHQHESDQDVVSCPTCYHQLRQDMKALIEKQRNVKSKEDIYAGDLPREVVTWIAGRIKKTVSATRSIIENSEASAPDPTAKPDEKALARLSTKFQKHLIQQQVFPLSGSPIEDKTEEVAKIRAQNPKWVEWTTHRAPTGDEPTVANKYNLAYSEWQTQVQQYVKEQSEKWTKSIKSNNAMSRAKNIDAKIKDKRTKLTLTESEKGFYEMSMMNKVFLSHYIDGKKYNEQRHPTNTLDEQRKENRLAQEEWEKIHKIRFETLNLIEEVERKLMILLEASLPKSLKTKVQNMQALITHLVLYRRLRADDIKKEEIEKTTTPKEEEMKDALTQYELISSYRQTLDEKIKKMFEVLRDPIKELDELSLYYKRTSDEIKYKSHFENPRSDDVSIKRLKDLYLSLLSLDTGNGDHNDFFGKVSKLDYYNKKLNKSIENKDASDNKRYITMRKLEIELSELLASIKNTYPDFKPPSFSDSNKSKSMTKLITPGRFIVKF